MIGLGAPLLRREGRRTKGSVAFADGLKSWRRETGANCCSRTGLVADALTPDLVYAAGDHFFQDTRPTKETVKSECMIYVNLPYQQKHRR